MKKTLKSLFETGVLHLAVLCLIFALALAVSGCSVTKISYEKSKEGVVSYSIYHNDHWLKRDTGAMSGGMSDLGKFELKLERATASPSEEFNRTMNTYTSAFVQLAQIAAAAYNPSASAVVRSQGAGVSSQESGVSGQGAGVSGQESGVSVADCPDGSCTDTDCPDGSCKAPVVSGQEPVTANR